MMCTLVSTASPDMRRGARDAAMRLNLGYGGWAARNVDAGKLPMVYASHVKLTADISLAQRLNVQDSDGTLIVTFDAELAGRALFVANACKQQRKPCKHLVLPTHGKARIPDEAKNRMGADL